MSDGRMMTSYFDFRLPASRSFGYTSVNGISKFSNSRRVQPDDIEPPYRSASAMRLADSFTASAGREFVPTKLTPRSAADFCTTAAELAPTKNVPAGYVLPFA